MPGGEVFGLAAHRLRSDRMLHITSRRCERRSTRVRLASVRLPDNFVSAPEPFAGFLPLRKGSPETGQLLRSRSDAFQMLRNEILLEQPSTAGPGQPMSSSQPPRRMLGLDDDHVVGRSILEIAMEICARPIGDAHRQISVLCTAEHLSHSTQVDRVTDSLMGLGDLGR